MRSSEWESTNALFFLNSPREREEGSCHDGILVLEHWMILAIKYPSSAVGLVLDSRLPPAPSLSSSHHCTLTLWISAQISTDFLLCRLEEGGRGGGGSYYGFYCLHIAFSILCCHPAPAQLTLQPAQGQHWGCRWRYYTIHTSSVD